MSDTDTDDDDDGAYYVVPEEAIQYLPQEWQEAIYARAEDGRKVLEAADKELKQLSRLSLSFYHVTVLKHIRDKLAVYRFKADRRYLKVRAPDNDFSDISGTSATQHASTAPLAR